MNSEVQVRATNRATGDTDAARPAFAGLANALPPHVWFCVSAIALINGVAVLKESGLDMAQIRQAGETLIKQAEAAAGPDLTNQVPSLRGHLGL
ncbi:hypothetical protein [Mesorhizobium sp.]|uniref:hypothetical protein n=1 Tax=Mesorhizobium sp. TaxID=1871066 RepID=UPI000FE4A1ED|nr:hypothetical protein [Mesorhizobium sp.]RWA81118.1 MAG: hypothetical protein EOQ30_20750 [Mesorhizobium sp.]